MQHYFQGVDSIKPWEILVILLSGCEEAFISGEKKTGCFSVLDDWEKPFST